MSTPAPDPDATERRESDSPHVARSQRKDAQFAPGTIIAARYRISGILGSGGMGEVYRADDIKLGQQVALKFLPARLARDATLLDRLHDEVRLGRQIAHPNVCRIYDIVEWESAHFVSMEYVDGEDLARLLHRIGRLSHDKAVDIARGIAAGLHAAHVKGILHRDLKPANVMIDSHGDARIMDFGLALAAEDDSQEGVIAGTPAYMAPEQITGRPATIQSDLYALGLVMYELFTGKRVHSGRTLRDRVRDSTSGITTPSDVVRDIDPTVERVILRCLDDDPSRRPRSAREVIESLPGGDPLAAALAAGETPSPRMVAAAGTEGTLKPIVAIGLLAAIVALFATLIFFVHRAGVMTMIGMDKPPEVQLDRASAMLRQLGIPRQDDTTFGFDEKLKHEAWVYVHDRASVANRWSRGLPLLSFWMREQREPFAIDPTQDRPAIEKPRQALPGASTIDVDPRGRLIALSSIASPSWKAKPLDWRALFNAAGLDIAQFTPIAPAAVPVSMADARAAWRGRHPEDGTPIRIEAAAWRGVPVLFRIVAPWDEVDETNRIPFGGPGFGVFILVCAVIAIGGGLLVARRNLRLRRGDRQGALRLGIAMFLLAVIADLFGTEHRLAAGYEMTLLTLIVASALFFASVRALLYVAVEPYIRRHYPDLLIAWTRFLEGRWRDPMVGRDILIGIVLGLVHACLATGGSALPTTGLTSLAHTGGRFTAEAVSGGINAGLSFMFGLMLFSILLRKRALAVGAIWVLVFAMFSFASHEPARLAQFAVIAALYAIAVGRFGLLTTVALHTTFTATFFNPTPGALAWYTVRAAIPPLLIVILALWAFRTSLGDQRLIATDL